jgi:hypothetical protein
MALSDFLEPFTRHIEEFIDPYILRGAIRLAVLVYRDKDTPHAAKIADIINVCTEDVKLKALRKPLYGKIYGFFRIIQRAISGMAGVPAEAGEVVFGQANTLMDISNGDWGMEDMWADPSLRWEEYLQIIDAVSSGSI